MIPCKYCGRPVDDMNEAHTIEGSFSGRIDGYHNKCKELHDIAQTMSMTCMKAQTCPHRDKECTP